MKERLRLCRDFGELRAGMIAVITNCLRCSGTHRGLLVSRCDDDERCDFSGSKDKRGWFYSPGGNHNRNAHYAWFAADGVVNKTIFIVEDGLDLQADTQEHQSDLRKAGERKRQRERAVQR